MPNQYVIRRAKVEIVIIFECLVHAYAQFWAHLYDSW